jgi:peptidoglycan/LPS O-acetylase OafA/YrhL
MPIANVLIQLGRTGSAAWIVVSLVLSSLCAWVSWTFVERPTLKRKKSAVRAIQA